MPGADPAASISKSRDLAQLLASDKGGGHNTGACGGVFVGAISAAAIVAAPLASDTGTQDKDGIDQSGTSPTFNSIASLELLLHTAMCIGRRQ